MKYIKLFMLMAAVTLLGACSSDDDSWNSASDVTVCMQKEEIKTKESAHTPGTTPLKVPIEVKGKTNGNIKVTIAVKEVGDNPAKEDENYYITTKSIVISDSIGYAEVETVDDDEVNADRTFEITLVDAQGAKIDENANSTTIILRDNDSEFYEKLQGTWKMTCTDTYENSALSWNVNITGATDEDDEDYNKYLYITGMMGYKWTTAILVYNYDKSTNKGSVSFDELGSYNFAQGVNFGDPIGKANVKLFTISGNQLTTTPIMGYWSDDLKSITFDDGTLAGGIFSAETGEFTRYTWFSIKDIKLEKNK